MIMPAHKNLFLIAPLGAVETKNSIVGGSRRSGIRNSTTTYLRNGKSVEFGISAQPLGSARRPDPTSGLASLCFQEVT